MNKQATKTPIPSKGSGEGQERAGANQGTPSTDPNKAEDNKKSDKNTGPFRDWENSQDPGKKGNKNQ